MSSTNGSVETGNIPLPSQTTSASTHTTNNVASVSDTLPYSSSQMNYYPGQYDQYQQYYQQYYANAYASMAPYTQQQYAAYYQASMLNSTLPNTAYNAQILSGVTNTNENDDAVDEEEEYDDDDDPTIAKKNPNKQSNTLTYHCNEKMGLNPLIYTNIQQSPYFKNNLFQLKTYHEVIDEIYYSVKHLEPWEKGSRKVSGQTGMCGSVRGVGAGGIISTPFCILFKLFTLRLTRKQVNGLIRHKDSPFIRALGFMYIRYTQPPQDLWNWYENYLDDQEEFDPKAGGGAPMTIGEMVRYLLTKLDWFSTLFPRIPIPIQKEIEEKLRLYDKESDSNNFRDRCYKKSEEKCTQHNKHPKDSYKSTYRSASSHSKNEPYSRRSRSRSPSGKYQSRHPKRNDESRYKHSR